MKKIIVMLMSLLMVMSLTGCANKKTTVDNQEQWDLAFEADKYLMGKTVSRLVPKENDMHMETTYIGNENAIKIVDVIEDETFVGYYVCQPEQLRYKYLYSVGDGIYGSFKYEFETLEQLQKDWHELSANFLAPSYGNQIKFEDVTYDKEKGCYIFNSSSLGDFQSSYENYFENGLVLKQVSSSDMFEGDKMVVEYTYQPDANEKVDIPDIKDKVSNAQEWKSLFAIDKYSNCTTNKQYDDMEIISQITTEGIEQTVYLDLEENLIYRRITRVDEKMEHVSEQQDDDSSEYEIYYDRELTCFEDNYAMLSYEDDLSEMYDLVKEVDDHYELEVVEDDAKSLFKIYISNGYIVNIEKTTEYDDGSIFEIVTSIEDFGRTALDE